MTHAAHSDPELRLITRAQAVALPELLREHRETVLAKAPDQFTPLLSCSKCQVAIDLIRSRHDNRNWFAAHPRLSDCADAGVFWHALGTGSCDDAIAAFYERNKE